MCRIRQQPKAGDDGQRFQMVTHGSERNSNRPPCLPRNSGTRIEFYTGTPVCYCGVSEELRIMSKQMGDQTLTITCQACGHVIDQTVNQLEKSPTLVCPSCHVTFRPSTTAAIPSRGGSDSAVST